MSKKDWPYYILVAAAWLVYAFLTFTAPITETSKKLGLTQPVFDLLRITIALPLLLIWLAAVYGALHLKRYAQSIKEGLDGQSLHKISTGLFILAFSMILSSLLGNVRSINIYNSSVVSTITIISNYLNAFAPLLAYFLIFSGSAKLLQNTNIKAVDLGHKIMALLPLALFAAVYIWLTFTNPNRQVPATNDSAAAYYLSDPLIVVTIMVPVILAWVLGVLSVVNIYSYMKNVPGLIYKQSLKYLAFGIVGVVSASILTQALSALGSARLMGISLGWLLGLVYVLLTVIALGYVLIAIGSKKLSKIESV
jgi:hypothetical protein